MIQTEVLSGEKHLKAMVAPSGTTDCTCCISEADADPAAAAELKTPPLLAVLKAPLLGELKSLPPAELKAPLLGELKSRPPAELKGPLLDERKLLLPAELKEPLLDELKSLSLDKLKSLLPAELKELLASLEGKS